MAVQTGAERDRVLGLDQGEVRASGAVLRTAHARRDVIADRFPDQLAQLLGLDARIGARVVLTDDGHATARPNDARFAVDDARDRVAERDPRGSLAPRQRDGDVRSVFRLCLHQQQRPPVWEAFGSLLQLSLCR